MKLWHKILLISLGLYALAFHAASIFFLSETHLYNIEQETGRAFADQTIIRERVEAGILATGIGAADDPGLLMERYSVYYSSLGIELGLYQISSSEIFGKIEIENVNQELLEFSTQEQALLQKAAIGTDIYQDSEKKYSLYVSSRLSAADDYILLYKRDITQLYQQRVLMIRAFIIIDIVTAVVLGLTAYILARKITRPLERLGKASEEIADGQYIHIEQGSRDETARLIKSFNKMSEAIRQREQDLQELANQRQNFIDNLTHEMNTPLTAIQGYASLVQQAKMSVEQKNEAMEIIEKEARRLRELYDKLMSMIMARSKTIDFQEIPLQNYLENIRKTMAPQLESKNITLTIDCLVDQISADPLLLEILLTNLIRNAITATENAEKMKKDVLSGIESSEATKNGVTKKIIITIKSSKNNQVSIEVKDYGTGISKEHIKQIFEPFYREDRSRSRKTGGAGLGLALCQEIADRHNGKIDVISEPGLGTTMKFVLPQE